MGPIEFAAKHVGLSAAQFNRELKDLKFSNSSEKSSFEGEAKLARRKCKNRGYAANLRARQKTHAAGKAEKPEAVRVKDLEARLREMAARLEDSKAREEQLRASKARLHAELERSRLLIRDQAHVIMHAALLGLSCT